MVLNGTGKNGIIKKVWSTKDFYTYELPGVNDEDDIKRIISSKSGRGYIYRLVDERGHNLGNWFEGDL